MAPPLTIPKNSSTRFFFSDHVFIDPPNVASTTLQEIIAFQKVQLDQKDVHFD